MYDIIFAYALLASGISANKFLLYSMSPSLLVGLRMFIAGLLLLIYTLYRSGYTFLYRVKEDGAHLLFIALCTTLVPALLKAYALKHMVSSKVTLLGSLDPFITALYAYILWSEQLTWKKIGGILIGMVGVTISVIWGMSSQEGLFMNSYISYPEIAILIQVAIGRFGWILVRQLMHKQRYSSSEINGICMFIAGLLALGGFFLFPGESYSTGCAAFLGLQTSSYIFVGALLYTIFIGNGLGYTLYARCLKKHNVTFMSLAGFLVPLFVALYGYALLGEPLTGNFFIAAATILIGLCLFYYDELCALI